MPATKIVYANLKAEMARRNVLIGDLARCIGGNREAPGRRLSKLGSIRLGEACKITHTFFPDKSVQEIFEEEFLLNKD